MRSGSVKWNVAPRPGSLSSHIRPPISVTRRDAIESPRPVPPNCRVIDPSACVNASKIACCFSRGMPMPVSATRTCSTTSAVALLVDADVHRDRALARELHRVADQVGDDLAEPPAVADQPLGQRRRHVVDELEPLLRRLQRQRPHRLGDHLVDREGDRVGLHLARFDLREVEDLVDQRHQRLRRGAGHRQALALLGRDLALEHQLGHARARRSSASGSRG